MTLSLLSGTAVSASERAAAAQQGPEPAEQHIRNALQLLHQAERSICCGKVITILGADYDAVCARLQKALDQLEGRA